MYKTGLLCITAGIVLGSCAAPEILLFTYAYNRPDFIEIQYKTFKKFLKDDYEFVVFNDAPELAMEQNITAMCERYGIRCIRIPQSIHSKPYLKRWPQEDYQHPTVRNCNVVMYSLNEVGFKHEGIVAIFDSDIFLVKEFSIKEYMQGYTLAGLVSGEVYSYLWIGLAFMDMRIMPNKTSIDFNCGRVFDYPVDAGGHTHYYLQSNPSISVKKMNHINTEFLQDKDSQEIDKYFSDDVTRQFLKKGPQNIDFLIDTRFLHYRSGTNWNRKSAAYHEQKTRLFNDYIAELLNS